MSRLRGLPYLPRRDNSPTRVVSPPETSSRFSCKRLDEVFKEISEKLARPGMSAAMFTQNVSQSNEQKMLWYFFFLEGELFFKKQSLSDFFLYVLQFPRQIRAWCSNATLPKFIKELDPKFTHCSNIVIRRTVSHKN